MNDAGRWRVAELVGEVWRNLSATRALLWWLAPVVLLLSVIPPTVAAADWISFRGRVDDAFERGAWSIIVSAGDAPEAGIEQESCRRATSLDFVVTAGHVDLGEPRSVLNLGAAAPVVGLSASLVREFGRSTPPPGFRLGSGRALLPAEGRELGATSDISQVRFADPVGVVTVANGAIRMPGTETESSIALLESAVRGRFAERCVIVLRALTDPSTIANLAVASLDVHGPPPTWRVAAFSDRSLLDAHLDRNTRHLAITPGLVFAALASITTLSRRSELAAYRFSGMARTELFALLSMEYSVVVGIGSFVGTMTHLLLALTIDVGVVGAVWAGLAGWALALTALLLVALVVCRANVIDMSKDR